MGKLFHWLKMFLDDFIRLGVGGSQWYVKLIDSKGYYLLVMKR